MHLSNLNSISLGVVMDPIAQIKPLKDTTLALLEAAQRKGWQLFYFEPQDLRLKQGQAIASAKQLNVSLNPNNWFELKEHGDINLSDLDVVLMRQDPPVNTEFLYNCHILTFVERSGTLVVNSPTSLLTVNEKILAQEFAHLGPPTIVSRDLAVLTQFLENYTHTVVKPLNEMGGSSVFRVDKHDANSINLLNDISQHGQRTILMQELIANYQAGDKRVLLIDGEPVPYGLNRIPPNGELRANLAAGGQGVTVELNSHDYAVCEEIAPRLRELKLLFVGIDLIDGYLTEINITSPTCVREINQIYQHDIAMDVINAIQARLPQSVQ